MIRCSSIDYPDFKVHISLFHVVCAFKSEDGIHITDSNEKNWIVDEERIDIAWLHINIRQLGR